MIDTHCHLLPGIDDGSRSETDALRLARRLHGEGVRLVVCTPHYSRRYPSALGRCEERLLRLRAVLADLNVPLELRLAAEIGPDMALVAPPAELEQRSMGGRFLVTELEPRTTLAHVEAILDRLSGLGLVPVLAHPERCRDVRRAPGILGDAKARGALVQVVAPSLAGTWGSESRLAAWRFVEEGVADIVASDAHTPTQADTFAAVARLVADRCGEERRRELFEIGPAQVAGESRLAPVRP